MSRFYCSGLSLSMVCRARVTHVSYELGMEELLVARNAGIDSTCRRFETGKAAITRYTHAKHEPILGIARYIRNSINYENIQPLDENLELQWNLSNTDTEGTEKGVRIRGVSIV